MSALDGSRPQASRELISPQTIGSVSALLRVHPCGGAHIEVQRKEALLEMGVLQRAILNYVRWRTEPPGCAGDNCWNGQRFPELLSRLCDALSFDAASP